jgi:hypothetical protein
MNGPAQTIARIKTRFPSPGHWWLFARITAWLLLLPLVFRLLSLSRLLRLLTPRRQTAFPEDPIAHTQLVCLYAMSVLNLRAKYRTRGACLPRSLILYRFARQAGLPAVFFLGLLQENGTPRGHSWVELNGQHLHDPLAHVPYHVTFAFPAEGDNIN